MPTPKPKRSDTGVRYFGAGVYHENIDVKSNETIYLAGGAVVFGSLNIWGADNVKILGRGIVVYDGPQDPNSDTGWMHRLNWHVIVMDHAHKVQISGITCVVRSRTWMIQMLDSEGIIFENVKVIGGNPANANQDGMDWLGGGGTIVRDCFIRASDDIFALYGNWLGYSEKDLTTPGPDVNDIRIEGSVLSTSISNVVRVSWPQKIFNSAGFVMRDSDVIHMGSGGCRVPFALLEIWDDPAGRGHHSGYLFDNIRLEHWYSLLQLRQASPEIRGVMFQNIWAIENASLAPSVLSGDVAGVSFKRVKIANKPAVGNVDIPMSVESGAEDPEYLPSDSAPRASFTFTPGVVSPGKKITFDASSSVISAGKGVSYEWLFGDGATASGVRVRHVFRDSLGTLLDRSGRFRVLLKVTDASGDTDWAYHPVVVTKSLQPSHKVKRAVSGVNYGYYEGSWSQVPDFGEMTPIAKGTVSGFDPAVRKRPQNYALVFEGYIDVPADGGYTFTLLSRDGGKLEIDSAVVATSPSPVAQVCGSVGNMVQEAKGSLGLRKGMHAVRVSVTHTTGEDAFALRWEGPRIELSDVPPGILFHRSN
ncbi:MAG: PKD domain-containing protein [Bryobacteraceae bacterium]